MSKREPYSGSDPYVFISYAHKNSDTVLPLIHALQEQDVRIWFDEGIEAGTEWPEYIAERLENSYCVIAFLSEAFTESQNCRREINFTIDLKRRSWRYIWRRWCFPPECGCSLARFRRSIARITRRSKRL